MNILNEWAVKWKSWKMKAGKNTTESQGTALPFRYQSLGLRPRDSVGKKFLVSDPKP